MKKLSEREIIILADEVARMERYGAASEILFAHCQQGYVVRHICLGNIRNHTVVALPYDVIDWLED